MLLGLDAGAAWTVRFSAFSLNATKGGDEVWDDPGLEPALVAMKAGVAVRDTRPDDFPRVHHALFAARHDHGLDIRQEAVVRQVLEEQEVDADEVLAAVGTGRPLETIREEHTRAVADHAVFGVPTVIAGDPPDAVFVRVMSRPAGDADMARRTVEQVLGLLVDCPGLNEFKHTRIPR